jgi:hypothetical protein
MVLMLHFLSLPVRYCLVTTLLLSSIRSSIRPSILSSLHSFFVGIAALIETLLHFALHLLSMLQNLLAVMLLCTQDFLAVLACGLSTRVLHHFRNQLARTLAHCFSGKQRYRNETCQGCTSVFFRAPIAGNFS